VVEEGLKSYNKSMSQDFYVYALLDPRKQGDYVYGEYRFNYEPFYIGKGKGDRCFQHFRYYRLKKNSPTCNKIKKIKAAGTNPIAIKIKENLSEEVAFELEKKLIGTIGRKDLDMGVLTNITNGGDGPSGVVISEERKQKLRELNIGEKNYMFGKHHSEETKRKIRETKNSRLYIISDETRQKKSEVMMGKKNHFFGKHHSEETKLKISVENKKRFDDPKERQKMSRVHKGKTLSVEHKQKIGRRGEQHNNFGKHHSEETRQRISKALQGKPAWNKGKIFCIDMFENVPPLFS